MLINNGQVEFEGAAEALFLASPAKKCKKDHRHLLPDSDTREVVEDVAPGVNDGVLTYHKWSDEELLEAHRQESDELMRIHFRKVGLQ